MVLFYQKPDDTYAARRLLIIFAIKSCLPVPR